MTKEIRDYQNKIVDDVCNSNDSVLIESCVASGKTFIIELIMEKLSKINSNYKFLYIIDRINLVYQFLDELTLLNKNDFDIIQADKTFIENKRYIVASKDSVITYVDLLPDNLIVFIDEVHIGLKQSKEIIDKLNPLRVIGLTGTPERTDGFSFIKGKSTEFEDDIYKYALFDKYIKGLSIYEAQRRGFLCDLKYVNRNDLDLLDYKSKGVEEFTEDELSNIFDKYNIWGDFVKTYKRFGKFPDGTYRPALGFSPTVEMANKIANIFNESGFVFKVLSGKSSNTEKETVINELKNKSINGIINADLLTYGVNCPEVSYIFLARHIKSKALWIQIVGRGLRNCPGKDNLFFIDHTDTLSEFTDYYSELPFETPNFIWNYKGYTKIEKQKLQKEKRELKNFTLKFKKILQMDERELVIVNKDNRLKLLFEYLEKEKKENKNLRELLKQMNFK